MHSTVHTVFYALNMEGPKKFRNLAIFNKREKRHLPDPPVDIKMNEILVGTKARRQERRHLHGHQKNSFSRGCQGRVPSRTNNFSLGPWY